MVFLKRHIRNFIMADHINDSKKIVFYVLIVLSVTLFSQLLFRVSRSKDIDMLTAARLQPDIRLEALYDFHAFPCYPITPSLSLILRGKCVRRLGEFTPGISLQDRCQFIPIEHKPSICTYKPLRVNESIFIHEEGVRHKTNIEIMVNILKSNPGMHFLDIGTSSGAYCIAAAFHTNKTICMNGNYKTLKLLKNSLIINHVENNARFIWNVLMDESRTVLYPYYETHDKYPTFNMDESKSRPFLRPYVPIETKYKVDGITLNDLASLFSNKPPVFLKLDMDYTEVSVLERGDIFLKVNDVRILQIVTIHQETANILAENLEKHGFRPYHLENQNLSKRVLQKSDIWPRDIYFMR